MITTEQQAAEIRATLALSRTRPATPESILALRTLAYLFGSEAEGAIAIAFEGRSSQVRKEAAGHVRGLHEDMIQARLRLQAEEEFAAQRTRWGRLKMRWGAFVERLRAR